MFSIFESILKLNTVPLGLQGSIIFLNFPLTYTYVNGLISRFEILLRITRQVQWSILYTMQVLGSDDIITGNIHHGVESIINWLLAIYNVSLRLLYIPWSWRIFMVIFITKAGNTTTLKTNQLFFFSSEDTEKSTSYSYISIESLLLCLSELHYLNSLHVKKYTLAMHHDCIQQRKPRLYS